MLPPKSRSCVCRTHVNFNVIIFCNVADFVVESMSNLTSRLSSLARCANQHILTSLNMVRATAVRTESRRAICSSAVRQKQESVEEAQFTRKTSSREFSPYPPLPGEDSALRWGGVKFEDLPIAHIKATYNNTHIQVTDCSGQYMARTSCGTEGFRNVKKSTPIAAQTAGISVAAKAQAKGVTFVRVVIKGLGPGRLSAIKGLTMGGLEVVSITDNTPVPHNGCRPRKARRM